MGTLIYYKKDPFMLPGLCEGHGKNIGQADLPQELQPDSQYVPFRPVLHLSWDWRLFYWMLVSRMQA